jgi:hypothetical protein
MTFPTEEEEDRSELIDQLRDLAEEVGQDMVGRVTPEIAKVLEMWLLREVHLAVRRAHEAMADGVPPDSAFFLAVDDMGFQLAHALSEAWRTG